MRNRAPLLSLIGLFLLSAGLAGCGREKEEIIARVNQQPITQRQLWQALEQTENGDVARRTLDDLIVRQLIRQEAQKKGFTASREEIDTRLEAQKDWVLAATGKDFATWLQETGQTEEGLASRISTHILTAKLVINEKEREEFFEDNKERLKTVPRNADSVIYRQIIVSSEEEAAAVVQELRAQAGENKISPEVFAKVAEERTLDPVEQQLGGMAGWLIKGTSGDPALEEVLFALAPGDVSDSIPIPPPPPPEGEEEPADQPQFYRIVMPEKKFTASEVTPEGSADVIDEWMLNSREYQLRVHEFFTNLRAKADIEILSPRYRLLDEIYKEGREARERRLSQERESLLPGVMAPEGEVVIPPAESAEPETE
ncbi:MAG: SurA N-terminal domain-containing protein [Armatimonadetes bacterium]|nr:SurA N-terminal domain-containing protein [Armatimonadota bacterium]